MIAEMMLAVAWELALFAGAVGILFAVDDLAVDALWLSRIGRRTQPLPDQSQPPKQLRYAILVPAWQEGDVIGTMLSIIESRWPLDRVRIYVGVYPNDFATIAAIAGILPRAHWLQMVIVDSDGPTTKGDCLNHLWRRLLADRDARFWLPEAVIIHDAEDVVDRHELLAHDLSLVTADYSQIPVVPLVHPSSPWISGHYLDEFAESHLKELAVREAIGGMLPTAGVGCAVRITALDRIAGAAGPFAADSLTEDYELGIRLNAAGARGALALYGGGDAGLVATRAYFPCRFIDAVRQKTRWMRGIALDGWDRTGWPQRPRADEIDRLATRWMLWRDRRTVLAAGALAAGYVALVLAALASLWRPAEAAPYLSDGAIQFLATIMTLVMAWRLVMRCMFTARAHGWQQGILAAPRLLVSNIILIACSWRALAAYMAGLRGRPVAWDKTAHEIPPFAASLNPPAAARR